MQSGYHNLPTICGTDRKDGVEYRAENVMTVLTGAEPSISMELAAAYPAAQSTVPDLTYVRRVTLKVFQHCRIGRPYKCTRCYS